MSIRTYKKDHLKELAQRLAAAANPENEREPTLDPLRFWTRHSTKSIMVDLTSFHTGAKQEAVTGRWSGRYSGRPALIAEIAPVLKELVEYAAANTISQYLHALRKWWRALDIAESSGAPKVSTVADLTDVHRQLALDSAMESLAFSNFVRLANLVRRRSQSPPLHWSAPERPIAPRSLPPKWQTDQIRFELKHRWFAAIFRWEKARCLLSLDYSPLNATEERLQANYLHFRTRTLATADPRPTAEHFYNGLSSDAFKMKGLSIPLMLSGFYPNAEDIRVAFNLCLANTGWNPSVLLDLDVEEEFLTEHPKDSSRYLLRGYKARGSSEQISEGLFKSQGSPGVILQTLMKQTHPLREKLARELKGKRRQLDAMHDELKSSTTFEKAHSEISNLERGLRSPWLYAVGANKNVQWLHNQTYGSGLKRGQGSSFLEEIIADMNTRRNSERQLGRITPSDFRDAFAANAYTLSGGMILYVMKALGHKSPNTTQIYLDNTLINEESRRLYKTFSDALWDEIKVNGRVDASVIAKISQDGHITADQRDRVEKYRSLQRSRLGVGCKNPHDPPERIAPGFLRDGKAVCSVQRCTLCVEHAVIFPDSLPGLTMRLAELQYLKSTMSSLAFIQSSFVEEIRNTELALTGFDPASVLAKTDEWSKKIADGAHRVIQLNGYERNSG
ncbi:hypothetical protein [Massilia violaceinigra]|uniref:hypothetical protein n=1 Tax=Massilia violaceinigra TaxID=2045208 RepID=UPI0012FD75F4|nr:hypothetical protein [Massilia violaceinigra]